ncbi:hypothetical protein [Leptolyngbya sp. GGD]|uniref:hypothetical protein n=1 Tax=Leptolyngbya sp. GGD TaxID=2997907 RepID=UPI00227BBE6C|nr:hypothetical protein [Leptolyngbya sp. GGD]MCY6491901.1 hypothetical protein [Leptolyngbya sp. GGD]
MSLDVKPQAEKAEKTSRDIAISGIAGLFTGGVFGFPLSIGSYLLWQKIGLKGAARWWVWAATGIAGVPISWAMFVVVVNPDKTATVAPSSSIQTRIERQKQAEAVKLQKQEQERVAELERQKIEAEKKAEEKAKFSQNFGFESIGEFQKACKAAIALESGSNDFGVFNSRAFEYPNLNSLVLNQSVYGTNAFGTKVEHQYKCWNVRAETSVQVELIDIKFH